MRIVYLALGGVTVALGLVEALVALDRSGLVHMLRGILTLLFGVVVFSLAGIDARLEAFAARLERLEQSGDGGKLREATVSLRARVEASTHIASSDEARALLREAQRYHFSKQFAQATRLYRELAERFPETKEANVARQQINNIKTAM